MKRIRYYVFFCLGVGLLSAMACQEATKPTEEPLLVFVGAASKPPTEEILALFSQETGIPVEAVFGGSGFVLSQMKMAAKGDLYFPGSSDFMELAKSQQLVVDSTEAILVYLVPAICVQRGNPMGITSLAHLARPNLRVALGAPENVCVGTYAVEIIEQHLDSVQRRAFRNNLVTYTESCDKTATVVALKSVDAVLGWSVFEHWNPAQIEVIRLPAHQIQRVGYLPVALSSFTRRPAQALALLHFLQSEKAMAVFRKYHYFTSPQEAFAYIGATKPVGGVYTLPAAWINH